MRILTTKKIWRAFPELDQFDDETCLRVVRRVWGMQNVWKYWLICISLIPLSWVFWLGIMIATSAIFDLSVYPTTSEILTLMQTGFIWMPIIALFLARDFWLRRQLRRQVCLVVCWVCEYDLIGLEIQQSDEHEYVLCPECGVQNTLDKVRLSREDIDPLFLTESSSSI